MPILKLFCDKYDNFPLTGFELETSRVQCWKSNSKKVAGSNPVKGLFRYFEFILFFFGLNWTTKIGPTLVLFWLTLFSIAVAQKCIQWRKMEVQKVLLGIDAYRMPKKILCYQQTIQKNTTTWEDVPKTTLRSTVNHTHTLLGNFIFGPKVQLLEKLFISELDFLNPSCPREICR